MKYLGIVAIACAGLVRAVPAANAQDGEIKAACDELKSGHDNTCLAISKDCLSNHLAQGYISHQDCLNQKFGVEGHIYKMNGELCAELNRGSDDACRKMSEKCLVKGKAQGFNSIKECLTAALGRE